ncbi:hypothetical protein L1987_06472 [Smallanthus sonchifolius]|uniref:Uncharacterized protein n=1 Tax=Smallanthus sonchifolius TaxID=185202 RepID=A0ACB9JY93_9ASTR|nr:hypothetical protein L1987_06472 [Smallanthus sonchifolius]
MCLQDGDFKADLFRSGVDGLEIVIARENEKQHLGLGIWGRFGAICEDLVIHGRRRRRVSFNSAVLVTMGRKVEIPFTPSSPLR